VDCLIVATKRLSAVAEQNFHAAWLSSLAAVPRTQRSGALPGITGHVAESVVAVVLNELGYEQFHGFEGPGRHGVDL
jgi:hypothetical protein